MLIDFRIFFFKWEIWRNFKISITAKFVRISDGKGTGNSLVTKYARSWEQCCLICSVTKDCLAVEMTNSQCTLLDSDSHTIEVGQTVYVRGWRQKQHQSFVCLLIVIAVIYMHIYEYMFYDNLISNHYISRKLECIRQTS